VNLGCGPCVARSQYREAAVDRQRARAMAAELGFLVGAGEGNRTLMTSLEGVPERERIGLDLRTALAV
jgi:hypothetical protein